MKNSSKVLKADRIVIFWHLFLVMLPNFTYDRLLHKIWSWSIAPVFLNVIITLVL